MNSMHKSLLFPMAAVSSPLLLLLLLLLLPDTALLFTSAASQRNSTIAPGSSLTPATPNNSYWLSPSGIYAFGFFPRDDDGYSVGIFMPGIPQNTVVWMANRNDPPVPSNSTLNFTVDGRLILRSMQEKIIAAPSRSAYSASMLDSGNFVLFGSGQNITWQSFDTPTDTLLEGQHLAAKMELYSAASDVDPSTGTFRVKMQEDGDLVMYPISTADIPSYAYWQSQTSGNGSTTRLNLSSDGLLYLVNDMGYVENITARGYTSSDIVYRARIDPDGIFRLYSYNLTQKGNWSTVWQAPNDTCDPKGYCGINGICFNNGQVATCQCIPGFEFLLAGDKRSGCKRRPMAGTPSGYNIEELPNILLEDNSYSFKPIQDRNECLTMCLQDLNCVAAIYREGDCRKQRFPLRYARKYPNTSDSLLVKVRGTTPSNGGDNKRPEERGTERIRKDILAVSVSFIAIAVVTIIVCATLLYRNRVWLYTNIPMDSTPGMMDDVAPRSFRYDELAEVTLDFGEEIGRGSFGTVYKGTMSDGQVVAAKRLEGMSMDGEREFQTEMKIIGRTHHRNLVRLLGYSTDGSNRILVYEYMSNGSLADLLFAQEKSLSWEENMEIAQNIARGLLYLHEECAPQIIHCDIKPGNILLDEHWAAKISDFGMSKLLKLDQTNTFTQIRGTKGYIAPEWHKKLPVTTKADVYSFGMVLLEIICRRRNMDQSLPEEEIILEHWVYDCFLAGELHKLVDEDDGVDRRQLERMVKIAIWCTQEEPSLRPSIRKVLLMLEGTIDIPAPPCPNSFISSV